MARLAVSFAIRSNSRVRELVEGRVRPEGIDLTISRFTPPDVFWRQLKFGDFDMSEMSMSSLLMAIANGDNTWTALPIFPERHFFHTRIVVRSDAGIEEPKDLAGRRVGVPDYQQTAVLWSRGVLMEEWGVQPTDIHWMMERTPELSHAGAVGFAAPDGVQIEQIPSSRNQREMLQSGDLDASLLLIPYQNMLDRTAVVTPDPWPNDRPDPNERIRPLFKSVTKERARYFAKTGFAQINHCVAVRTSVLEANPWAAINLYSAFVESKRADIARVQESLALAHDSGVLGEDCWDAVTRDLYPYGLAENQPVLETLFDYSYEQGLTPRRLSLDEVFFHTVRDF